MDITPALAKTAPVINAYGDGRFTVAGEAYRGSILIIGGEVRSWDVQGGPLTPSHFSVVMEVGRRVDILLIGTGARAVTPGAEVTAALRGAAGIRAEAMDTGAACRTFNVLLAEGRRVAAALVAV